jgi:D-aminoacyl-tRNA deacylase
VRAVVQRVTHARVVVEGNAVGAIGPGLLVYLGIGQADTEQAATWMIQKILGLRIFQGNTPDTAEKLHRSLIDTGGELLLVSQFTLYGDVTKGRRPSFEAAMAPGPAEALYNHCVTLAQKQVPVQTGRFRAHMQVSSDNDGPITILLESPPA